MHSSEQSVGSRPITHDAAQPPVETVEVPEHGHGDDGEHIHLPPPTIWPVTMAAGIAVAGWGLLTIQIVSIFGIIILFIALTMWIQELRHEVH